MSDLKYNSLRLESQLCFPLYACSKEVVRKYKPLLDAIDLTYTQYIAMMVLWEKREINVKELGNHVYLDSGTMTPVLKKLESKDLITRTRSKNDERNLIVRITEKGLKLRDEALKIPIRMGSCINLSKDEAEILYKLLYKVLGAMEKNHI